MMLKIKPNELLNSAEICAAKGQNALTAMFGADERELGAGYAIYILFTDLVSHDIKTIRVDFPADSELTYESLTPLYPAAAWYEREINDMFGLRPLGHPDLRTLVLHETFPWGYYPLRKDVDAKKQIRGQREYNMSTAQGNGVFEVAVGPIHAGIIEPGHFRFSQAGEDILQLDAKLFFTHRGIEKLVEGKSIDEALIIVERICGACTIANTLSYCQALEKLTEEKVPKYAWLLRMLLAEVERLYNHVGDTGNLCAGLGFAPIVSMGSALKEKIMHCNESLAGNRFLRGIIIPGGVRKAISPETLRELQVTLAEVEKGYENIVELLANHSDFLNRVHATGIVRKQTAVDLALVGVAARASGIDVDCRRDLPYGYYHTMNFDVPVEHSGDVYARLVIREREVTQSLKLLRQIINNLENSATQELSYENANYRTEEGSWGISESARGSNLHWLMLDKKQKIYRLFVRSASYPNWPALTMAVQGDIIPDFPLINKSFELCYACVDR
ncbi:MAG: NADH-quinone oxidoreductase subunit C [Acidaminococcaceae bacterium]|nr:NADH-quinone oxidoreductase subunit C [Acidaminococcaceae bacterium]MDD4721827.1 NADH-quinone oxidoreductase subunit C [Acidaminococcaceae bacterium]